jgi:drug/metabolite transporter (DMT)-like permease
MTIGALTVSASAIFIDLSHASPGTASFYRCLLALPLLGALALRERRHAADGANSADRANSADSADSPHPVRRSLTVIVAGVLFAGDMLLWTRAIFEVGAGLSTVLVNAQVVMVPLLARLIDGERLHRRYLMCLPGLCLGVVLTGGVLEHGVSGTDPAWGTVHAILAAVCYSGFLYLLRRSGREGGIIGSYTAIIAVAAVAALVGGALWHGIDVTPGWAAVGWLAVTAVCGQVLGWLFVARAAPHLPSDAGAALLMLTPVGALVLSAVVLGERPSPLQLAGAVIMLVSAYLATSHHAERRDQQAAEQQTTLSLHGGSGGSSLSLRTHPLRKDLGR